MSAENPTDAELKAIEAALGALTPSRSRLDRDALMFQAGVRSARATLPGRWTWPAIAATLAVVSVTESIALAIRPATAPAIVERTVVIREPAAAPPGPAPSPPIVILSQQSDRPSPRSDESEPAGEYRRIQERIRRFGLEGLPEPPLLTLSTDPENGAGAEPAPPLRANELDKFLNFGGPS